MDKYCKILTNKKLQLADWRMRPLKENEGENMVEYARQDTHYLIYIYEKMKEEIGDQKSAEERQQGLQVILDESRLTCL